MDFLTEFRRTLSRKGGFTIVPNCLLTGSPMTLSEGRPMEFRHRMLLLALLAIDYKGGWFKASQRLLKRSGLGTNSIALATKELVAAGFLQVRRMENCMNEYNLDRFYQRYLEQLNPAPQPEPEPEKPAWQPSAELQAIIEREQAAMAEEERLAREEREREERGE